MKRRAAAAAALAYTVLTIVFTWPIPAKLTAHVPGDFGDPLLNAWILAWDATHWGRGWWSANIFYPHPLALAYSEHLLPQALQIAPLYALTSNPLLCYNLLFLSTFVLSGLGMFLFAREITGSGAAAFVAGVAYAFAPYRVASIPHLQVLSSAWIAFALYGFRRYFDGGFRTRPLAGGAAAWLAQNLSCGYYLFFFSPIVAGYLAWEMTVRSLWTRRTVLTAVAGAVFAVALVTAVFLLPYAELRSGGFNPRSIDETVRFSADTYAYFTADPNLHLWGRAVQAWPHAEGALFPGITIAALGLIGAITAGSQRTRPTPSHLDRGAPSDGTRPASNPTDRRAGPFGPAVFAITTAALLVAMLLGWSLRLPFVRVASLPRAALVIALAWLVLLLISRDARQGLQRWLPTTASFMTLALLFAVVMSWGPSIRAQGRTIAGSNLYTLFYDYVPGFDGLRSPARFGMLIAFALAALAASAVARIVPARRTVAAIAISAAIVIESAAMPIPIDQNSADYRQPGLAPLPATVWPPPPIYQFVSTLPPSSAILELPLGEPAFDVRYMLYSTAHWRRLVNGYSGGGPAAYEQLDLSLQDAATRPERAWQALVATTASHVIVHEASYARGGGARMSEWLQSHGAEELTASGSDRIFRIR